MGLKTSEIYTILHNKHASRYTGLGTLDIVLAIQLTLVVGTKYILKVNLVIFFMNDLTHMNVQSTKMN